MVDYTNIKGEVPIAMFVGTKDNLGDTQDARWARDTIKSAGNAIKFYQEIKGGHASFMVGKDMSYFENVIQLIKKYNIWKNQIDTDVKSFL